MKQPAWTDFQPATLPGNPKEEVYMNSRYQVNVRRFAIDDWANAPCVSLSIKRRDKGSYIPWRDLQKIKNDLVGPECEGVELFPAESRLVDTANQRWLFCFPGEFKFPFGFNERLVVEKGHAALPEAKQEPFEPHVRPADLEDCEAKFDRQMTGLLFTALNLK